MWQKNEAELWNQKGWVSAWRNNDFERPKHEAKVPIYMEAVAINRQYAAKRALEWSKAKQRAGRHVIYDGDENDTDAINAWAIEEKARMEAWAIAAVKASALAKARQQKLEQVAKEREEARNRPYIPYFPMTRWP